MYLSDFHSKNPKIFWIDFFWIFAMVLRTKPLGVFMSISAIPPPLPKKSIHLKVTLVVFAFAFLIHLTAIEMIMNLNCHLY